jgi:hypothetical protein
MPSVSKAQQQAAGIAKAIQKGERKAKPGTPSAEMAKMSGKDLDKFAKTKTKGLPKHVKESFEQKLDTALFS